MIKYMFSPYKHVLFIIDKNSVAVPCISGSCQKFPKCGAVLIHYREAEGYRLPLGPGCMQEQRRGTTCWPRRAAVIRGAPEQPSTSSMFGPVPFVLARGMVVVISYFSSSEVMQQRSCTTTTPRGAEEEEADAKEEDQSTAHQTR